MELLTDDEVVDLGDNATSSNPLISIPTANQVGIVSVRVFDPLKQGDGINATVYYRIESKRIESHGAVRHESTRRRFSDFIWLRSTLQSTYPGCITPPLPAKSVLGGMHANFIDKRQRGLDRFLNRVISHCQLKNCDMLDAFLTATESDFEALKSGRVRHEHSFPISSAGFMNLIQHTLQTVQGTLRPAVVVEKSADDLKWDAIGDYIGGLHKMSSQCLSGYESIVNAEKDLAQANFDMGLSLTLFAELEKKSNHQQSSRAVLESGQCADRVSVLIRHQLEKEYSAFKEPLRDLVRTVEAVQEALAARQSAVNTVNGLEADLRAKKTKVDSARAKRAQSKLDEYESEIGRLEQEISNAKTLLNIITADLTRDFEQFQVEKSLALKSMTIDYVNAQVETSQKMCASWQAAAEELSRMS